ncbi:MAG: hypothetical protein IPL79_05260 [Myxococcales bacterium]|nr:hypothetical protein [Myxococcales bacterium]
MAAPAPTLTKFRVTRPTYERSQALDWLAAAHAEAQVALEGLPADKRSELTERFRKILERCGGKPNRIESRGFMLPDHLTTCWTENRFYKGVEWFVKNSPRDLNLLRLFLKPVEVAAMCRASGMEPAEIRGSRPVFGAPLLRMLATGVVSDDVAFTFTRSKRLTYTGFARRSGPTVSKQ